MTDAKNIDAELSVLNELADELVHEGDAGEEAGFEFKAVNVERMGKRRWHENHVVTVSSNTGRFWQIVHDIGASENQDSTFNCEPIIEVERVEKQVTVVTYQPKKAG